MTVVHQSAKLGRYGFTTLTVLFAFLALYYWAQAIMAWGAQSWADAMTYSIVLIVCVACVSLFERVENWGE